VQLQERRRMRRGAAIAAPVITSATYAWNPTADVTVNFTFPQGIWPVATIEVYADIDGNAFQLIATVASTDTSFVHRTGLSGEAAAYYKLRYRDGAVKGPFSVVQTLSIEI